MSEMTAAVHTVELEQINLIVWTKTNAAWARSGAANMSSWARIKSLAAPSPTTSNLVNRGAGVRTSGATPERPVLDRTLVGSLQDTPRPNPWPCSWTAFVTSPNRGDIVVDTFSGSGSTLIACEKTERRFRGIEIDPLYVDLAIRRWQRDTGLKATLTGSGTPFDEIGATAGLDTGDAEPNAKDNERAEPAEGLV